MSIRLDLERGISETRPLVPAAYPARTTTRRVPVMTWETDRLLLRPPVAADLDPFVEIHEHPEVRQFAVALGQASGRSAAWRMLALLIGHWHLRGYGQWTVIEKSTRDVVGRVGLWHPEGWPGLEIGWVIRRSCWNRGFATEAAAAARDFAFQHVGATHVISMIRSDNHRSIRVAEKIGETLEGTHVLEGAEVLVYGMKRTS